MDIKLFGQALLKVFIGAVIAGILIFVPAGSFDFWQGWLFMAVLFIPMIMAGVVMMIKSPNLLRKRLNAKEEQEEQKMVVVLSTAIFIASFITAGMNYRFGWILLPDMVSYIAAVVFL